MHITEREVSDFSTEPTGDGTRMYTTDHLMLGPDGGNPYTWMTATIDLAAGGNTWAVEHLYNWDTRSKIGMNTTSAIATYTPAVGSGSGDEPERTLVSSGEGLVYEYGYDSENESVGSQSVKSVGGTAVKVVETTRRSDLTFRKHLPSQIVRFRTESGSPTDDEKEVVTIDYGFREGPSSEDTALIGWKKTTTERETTSENGPGGSVETWEFYGGNGLLLWEIDEEDVITRYEYDDLTGELVTMTLNADPPTMGEEAELLLTGDASGAFPGSGGSGGELITEYEYDLLGRTIRVTQPGGVERYMVRELREDQDRPGILYYSVIGLPHKLAGTSSPIEFDGPACIRYFDAHGQLTRDECFEMSTAASYDPPNGTFTITTNELSRTTFEHDLSGTLVAVNEYWNIADNEYYTTQYEHDGFGRMTSVINGNGTVTERVYDVLDRVIEVKMGVESSPGTVQTIAEYYYDEDPATAAGSLAQGVGNGNLTVVKLLDGENDRITRMYYDQRDRRIATLSPDSPISVTRYDNLDRAVEQALYPEPGFVPTLANVRDIADDASLPNDPSTPNFDARSRNMETRYSQRGTVYRRELWITPGSASSDTLEWNSWYDDDGLLLAEWAPNSASTIYAYDALDRTTKVMISDRGGDSSFSFLQATSATGDVILEQYEYDYDTAGSNPSGVLEMITTRKRVHDTSAMGELTTGSDSVTTYTGFLYDDAQRRVAGINFGTYKTGTDPYSASAATAPTLSSYAGLSDLREDGDLLYTWQTYNTRGLVASSVGIQVDGTGSTTSAADITTRYLYDDMNRNIAVVENADAVSSVTWDGTGRYEVSGFDHTAPEKDRVTSVVYDAIGNVITRVAHIPMDDGMSGTEEGVQITEYDYGTSYTTPGSATDEDSFIASNDLLRAVRYPNDDPSPVDPDDLGKAGTTPEFTVSYAYNALGELRGLTDQNQTIHAYERDLMGRMTADTATIPMGSDIDDTIDKIGYVYDGNGRLETVTSYTGSTTVRDQVEFTYTNLWEVESIAQEHGGVVTGSSPTVEYVRDVQDRATETDNFSRVTGIIYPVDNTGGSPNPTVEYFYDDTSMDDQISRVSRIDVRDWKTTGLNQLMAYERIGLHKVATAEYPIAGTSGVVLDRIKNHDGTSTTGAYPAFDRYGRVVEHRWVRGDYAAQNPVQIYATQPAIIEIEHTYDRMSNRLTYDDARHQLEMPNTQREFEYDRLNRVTQELREDPGTVNGAYDNNLFGQDWQLDTLGNWDSLKIDMSDDGTIGNLGDWSDTRTFDPANQLEQDNLQYDRYQPNDPRTVPVDPTWYDYEFDANGNQVLERYDDMLPFSGDLTDRIEHTYDAWNRLVKTALVPPDPDVVIAEYTYNGLHWRTSKMMDSSTGAYNGVDQKRSFYYDASWRMVEERVDADNDGDSDWISQQFWGLRYIDDAIAKRVYREPDEVADVDAEDTVSWTGSDTTDWLQLSDTQFSVSAVLRSDAVLYERVYYDAYGNADHRFAGDATGDGTVDFFDIGMYAGAFGKSIGTTDYNSDADADFDGDVDAADQAVFTGWSSSDDGTTIQGWLSSPSSTIGPDNSIGYAGYVFNHERSHYTVRFRNYDPELGRWMQRDPAAYIDEHNIYQYVRSSTMYSLDPLGLYTITFDGFTQQEESQIQSGINAACSAVPQLMNHSKEYRKKINQKYPDDGPGGKNRCVRNLMNARLDKLDQRLGQIKSGCSGTTPVHISPRSIGSSKHANTGNKKTHWNITGFPFRPPTTIGSDPYTIFLQTDTSFRPSSAWFDQSPEKLAAILLHEFAHVEEFRSGDRNWDNSMKRINHVNPFYIQQATEHILNGTRGNAFGDAESESDARKKCGC
jgi:RHS repeat-associated protein